MGQYQTYFPSPLSRGHETNLEESKNKNSHLEQKKVSFDCRLKYIYIFLVQIYSVKMSAAVEMKNLVKLIKLSPPDLMVVSMEGMKFPTWRLLLAMHSPLMANLLVQTLRPGDEGLLAVTLPLPFPSVSSMLASLGEGGNLDHLGEAAQLLIGNNSSAPSQVTTKEGNLKNFQTMAEIPVFVDKVSHKMLSSTFVSTKAEVEERNQGGVYKADSTNELIDDQHSLVSTDTSLVQNTMLEISSKECKIDQDRKR